MGGLDALVGRCDLDQNTLLADSERFVELGRRIRYRREDGVEEANVDKV
jgi:hypothetical protein